jgi:hypothetical protein
MRDVNLIALWRKVAASARLTGKRRLAAIDKLASADGVYFTSLEDAGRHKTATPNRARILVQRLLRKLANDERASVRARDSAVMRLAFISGHAVSGLFRVGETVPNEAEPMTVLESIAAEISLLKEQRRKE